MADDPALDPVFDRGMTAHANRIPRPANPHQAGTEAHAAWDAGWLTGEARGTETTLDGALL